MTDERRSFVLKGYELIEKFVRVGNDSSGRLNMPKSWEGKRVAVVRLEELERER